jgi:hypothetical protein
LHDPRARENNPEVSQNVSESRGLAARVARWLVQRERPEDAVALLSAWAARGPNDTAGQGLLAEALRIDPGAKAAQQAFERMEGIRGKHPELEEALQRFDQAELDRLQKGIEGPTFKGAQIGFNNNIRAKDQLFHIQTEDSGLNAPHVITHLFADGGRVVKSYKRSYATAIDRESDIAGYVRQLMKAQHLEMVFALRNGQFDDILAGKAIGGMEVLEHYPDIDLSKLGGGRGGARPAEEKSTPEKSTPAAAPPLSPPPPPLAAPPLPSSSASPASRPAAAALATSMPAGARPARTRSAVMVAPGASQQMAAVRQELYTLHVLRSLSGGPGRYAVGRRDTVIGSGGEISLPGETFCHPREATLKYREGRLFLERLDGFNGVFLRIQKPVVMSYGEEFIVGDQLLRIEENPVSDDAPDPHPTYFYSSPRWPSSFRVVQVLAGGARGACLVARGSTLQVGSAIGDLILSNDPLVDAQHCLVEEQAGSILLTDLDSRNGVFVRSQARQELVNGDEIVIGRTHLVVDIDPTRG